MPGSVGKWAVIARASCFSFSSSAASSSSEDLLSSSSRSHSVGESPFRKYALDICDIGFGDMSRPKRVRYGYMKRRKWRTVSRISQLLVARVLQRKKKEKKNLSEK